MRNWFIAGLMFTTLLAPAWAKNDVSAASLVGQWSASEKHPTGAIITSVFELSQAKKFTSTTTVNGKPYLDASGTWTLAGNKLEWHYETASSPAIPAGYVDTDEVTAVNAEELVLTSKQTGLKHTYTRVHQK